MYVDQDFDVVNYEEPILTYISDSLFLILDPTRISYSNMYIMKNTLKIDDEIISFGYFSEEEYFSIQTIQSYQSSKQTKQR